MMKKQHFILVVILLLTISGCKMQSTLDIKINNISGEQTMAESKSIFTMSEVEIIQKSAEFLKSKGESVAFRETEITLYHSDCDCILCKNTDDEPVYYEGNYLQVKLYPDIDPNNDATEPSFIIFVAENGNVLGYYKADS